VLSVSSSLHFRHLSISEKKRHYEVFDCSLCDGDDEVQLSSSLLFKSVIDRSVALYRPLPRTMTTSQKSLHCPASPASRYQASRAALSQASVFLQPLLPFRPDLPHHLAPPEDFLLVPQSAAAQFPASRARRKYFDHYGIGCTNTGISRPTATRSFVISVRPTLSPRPSRSAVPVPSPPTRPSRSVGLPFPPRPTSTPGDDEDDEDEDDSS
jgi:hypothetical protein